MGASERTVSALIVLAYERFDQKSVEWARAVSRMCAQDRVQHRLCLSPETAAKAGNGEKARRPITSNRVIEVGFDKKVNLELSRGSQTLIVQMRTRVFSSLAWGTANQK